MRIRAKAFNVALLIILGILLFFTLFPLYFMIVSSLKTNFQLQTNYFGIPQSPQYEYYTNVFAKIKVYLKNSTVISGLSAIGVIFVSCLSAYVFARFEFPLKKLLFFLILMFLMIPGILTLVPQFVLVTKLGLINSPFAAILPYIASDNSSLFSCSEHFLKKFPRSCLKVFGWMEDQSFRLSFTCWSPPATARILPSEFSFHSLTFQF